MAIIILLAFYNLWLVSVILWSMPFQDCAYLIPVHVLSYSNDKYPCTKVLMCFSDCGFEDRGRVQQEAISEHEDHASSVSTLGFYLGCDLGGRWGLRGGGGEEVEGGGGRWRGSGGRWRGSEGKGEVGEMHRKGGGVEGGGGEVITLFGSIYITCMAAVYANFKLKLPIMHKII